ncbi:MAG: calcium/sodium antiporter [Clostridia bacterium]|nr:calcium/sodium antiporter [Clostridia bacterium]
MIPDFYSQWHVAWQILMFVAFLAVGIFCLVKFCNVFVDSSSALAKRLHVAPMIIGLTVVAMGTSAPELAVSVFDSVETLVSGGHANVAIGNVVGSNICNILLVLGFSVLFTPIIIDGHTLHKEFPVLLFVTVICLIFGLLFGLNASYGDYAILRWEGIVLVVLMVAYLVFLIVGAKRHPDETPSTVIKDSPVWKSLLLIVLGAAGIAFGGEAVVFGAKGLALVGAKAAGVDADLAESLVGLTIVAVGTSLPELVTSVVAAKKGENDLALGNVIGSNVFNILFVLGISATVNPLTTGESIVVDMMFMTVVTVLLYLFSLRGKLTKGVGVFFIGAYFLYLVYLILRTLSIVA